MKIVVRGANWIGDSVMTIPGLKRLRSRFPNASIYLHTRGWAEGVFRDADFLDGIIPIVQSGSKVGNVLAQARELKKHSFDSCYLFPNSFESALVAKLSGIKERIGYSTEKRGIFLTTAVPVPFWKTECHESNYYLNLIERPVEIDPSTTTIQLLDVSEERRDKALKLLTFTGDAPSVPIVALGPGSTNSLAKRWPAENFASLSSKLCSDLGAKVVLLGSIDDAIVAARLLELTPAPVINLTGKTDLATATAILSVADLFISNDMGLAHIAAATGTPTIVIFGPTNELTTHPLGPRVEIIREPVECSPCMLRTCPIDHRCMTRITPERVFESAVKMLETQAR
jgi:heptosyltransferase II